jgi:hypothetical protein
MSSDVILPPPDDPTPDDEAAADAPPPSGEGRLGLGKLERRLALVITAVVIWLGVVQVLESRSPEPAPDAGDAVVAPPGLPAAEHPAVDVPPEIVDEAWGLRYDEDLSRVDVLRWSGLVEVGPDGEERPYRGKLTLRFGPDLQESFPIAGDAVEVRPRRAYLEALAASGTLTVDFKHHVPVEHDLGWLKLSGAPEVVSSDVQAERTTVRVRNPSIAARTVRVRAGWRQVGAWIEGASAKTELVLAAGEVRELSLEYAASTEGELSEPVARSIAGLAADAPPAADAPSAPAEPSAP